VAVQSGQKAPPEPAEVSPPSPHPSAGLSAPRSLGRAAVCSTVKDVRERIGSWVRWHVHLGFERIYLFFDDPLEAESVSIARAAGGMALVALIRDSDTLRDAWARQPSWKGMGHNAEKDVQIRQLLNAQLAMELARSAGLVWLLHIDSDELFLPRPSDEEPSSVVLAGRGSGACEVDAAVGHFASLAAAGCECFIYHNHEAVPERLPPHASTPPPPPPALSGGTDPFMELDLFKLSESVVPWRTRPSAAAAVEDWRRRTKVRAASNAIPPAPHAHRRTHTHTHHAHTHTARQTDTQCVLYVVGCEVGVPT
jgi:hypothetical protein